MKILHIIGRSEFGGATVHVFSILEMLKEKGHDVALLSTNSETISSAKKRNIPIVRDIEIQRNINIYKDIKALVLLTKYLKHKKYDIVHTHTSKGGFIGRIAAKLAGINRIIHTVHGFSFQADSPDLKKIIYGSLERIAGWCTDTVITVNNEDRKTAIEKNILPKGKVITIYNGVKENKPISKERIKECREEFDLKEDDIVTGIPGRLCREKGHLVAIKAIKKLITEYPNVKLLIIGKGPDEELFKERVKKLNLTSNVIFTGFRRDMENWFEIMDIFLLPSFREGMSITLLEAMAAEKPIICTDIRGNREVITDNVNGLIVKPGNSDEIKEKIKILIEDENLKDKLAKQAYEDYKNKFTQSIMLDKTSKVYGI